MIYSTVIGNDIDFVVKNKHAIARSNTSTQGLGHDNLCVFLQVFQRILGETGRESRRCEQQEATITPQNHCREIL